MTNFNIGRVALLAALALGTTGFVDAAEKPPAAVPAYPDSRDYGLM